VIDFKFRSHRIDSRKAAKSKAINIPLNAVRDPQGPKINRAERRFNEKTQKWYDLSGDSEGNIYIDGVHIDEVVKKL